MATAGHPANIVNATDEELSAVSEDTYRAISENLWQTAASLSVSTTLMSVLVILIAIWMASVFTRRIAQMVRGISRFRAASGNFVFARRSRMKWGPCPTPSTVWPTAW